MMKQFEMQFMPNRNGVRIDVTYPVIRGPMTESEADIGLTEIEDSHTEKYQWSGDITGFSVTFNDEGVPIIIFQSPPAPEV